MCYGVDALGVDLLQGGCSMAWLAEQGGCYGPVGAVQAVGTAWVVALGAGMLVWACGGVCGGWGCGMSVFRGPWVQGGLLQCLAVAWGAEGAEP